MSLVWTTPFHGVQHLGVYSVRAPWATVTDHGSFAEMLLWFPGCGFEPQRRDFATVARARQAAELALANTQGVGRRDGASPAADSPDNAAR